MNTLLEPEVKTYLGAIIRLIDHATEMHPHFESNRGQTDIADAREALNRLCSEYELHLCAKALYTLDSHIAFYGLRRGERTKKGECVVSCVVSPDSNH